jgi:hypothetical protein
MRSNVSLGGTIQSADNEMSKGAVSISPVDNTKDELYAILRKRLFKEMKISETEKKAVIDAYFAELQTAKKAGLIERALPTIREELEVSYPFHFSTKHLIETFNDNPGFQKTRDVIRLMASIVRSIWGKGTHEVDLHTLLSLASPDLKMESNTIYKYLVINHARVAKLADAPDLGSGGEILRGSSPLPGTSKEQTSNIESEAGSPGVGCWPLDVRRQIMRHFSSRECHLVSHKRIPPRKAFSFCPGSTSSGSLSKRLTLPPPSTT